MTWPTGRSLSAAHKQKMRLAHTGKVFGPAWCAHIKAAALARRARERAERAAAAPRTQRPVRPHTKGQ